MVVDVWLYGGSEDGSGGVSGGDDENSGDMKLVVVMTLVWW